MANATTIKQRLQEFGEFGIQALQAEIERQGLTDTGSLARSLESKVTEDEKATSLSISGAAYIVSLDRGSKPLKQGTTGQFVNDIKAWAERKLEMDPKESLGFAIAYMKRRSGQDPEGGWQTTDRAGNYLVPNRYNEGGLIGKSLTDAALDELFSDITKLAGEEMKDKIRTILK